MFSKALAFRRTTRTQTDYPAISPKENEHAGRKSKPRSRECARDLPWPLLLTAVFEALRGRGLPPREDRPSWRDRRWEQYNLNLAAFVVNHAGVWLAKPGMSGEVGVRALQLAAGFHRPEISMGTVRAN